MGSYERKTGPGYTYILCDICSRKIRQKDAILITDKWNTKHGLLVCKDDADQTNMLNKPFTVKETQISNPKLLRSEPEDRNIVNANSNRVPGAPTNLRVNLHPLNNSIYLQWQGPQDNGTDPITGYVILRVAPQGDTPTVLVADTGNSATAYEDTVSSPTVSCTYSVKAINIYGTGNQSNLVNYR